MCLDTFMSLMENSNSSNASGVLCRVCIIDQLYLHEEDVVLPGGRDELSDLSEVHGEGFLTQHVLPSVEEQQTHLQMMCVEDTDVQHI